MSLLSRLFGGRAKEAPAAPSEEYRGFAIRPDPAKADDGWRIRALVEKDGRSHELIRADTLRDRESAAEASVLKAKQMIDQVGERIFD